MNEQINDTGLSVATIASQCTPGSRKVRWHICIQDMACFALYKLCTTKYAETCSLGPSLVRH